MKIIDAHTHIGNEPNSRFAETSFAENLQLLLKDLKSSKIDHAIILPDDWKEAKFDPNTETVLEITQDVSNLTILGSLDVLNHTRKEFTNLEHWLREKKIAGIKLYPGYQYFYPDDEVCDPIYELAEKYEVPVLIHSGDTSDPMAKIKYTNPRRIDDVATDHPNLKIIIAHVGNPWTVDCAQVVYKNKNVYADISGLLAGNCLDKPAQEVTRKRLRDFVAYAGAEKLIYGSDWPIVELKPYLKFVKSIKFPKKDLEKIYYRNAAELFRINV